MKQSDAIKLIHKYFGQALNQEYFELFRSDSPGWRQSQVWGTKESLQLPWCEIRRLIININMVCWNWYNALSVLVRHFGYYVMLQSNVNIPLVYDILIHWYQLLYIHMYTYIYIHTCRSIYIHMLQSHFYMTDDRTLPSYNPGRSTIRYFPSANF